MSCAVCVSSPAQSLKLLLKPCTVTSRPGHRSCSSNSMALTCSGSPGTWPGNTKVLRGWAALISLTMATARSHSGTRCSFFIFMRSAGMFHTTLASRSNSLNGASMASLVRTAVRIVLRELPDSYRALSIAAASCALAGRDEEAKRLMARLLEIDPALGISKFVQNLRGPYRQPEHAAKYTDALRKAGLPG